MGHFVMLWPAPVLTAVLLAERFGHVAWIVSMLALLSLWPVGLVVSKLFGPRAGFAASAGCASLILGWAFIPSPAPVLQPVQLDQRFVRTGQAARHTIRLPIAQTSWRALWETIPPPEASVWFLIAADPGITRRLVVHAGPAFLGHLDRTTAVAGSVPDVFGRRDWHRLPIASDTLVTQQSLEIVVRPDPAAEPPDGQIGLLGGFSFRPTSGSHASAFFDGAAWSSSPNNLFDLTLPRSQAAGPIRPADRYRYFVELRVIEPATGRILAIYY